MDQNRLRIESLQIETQRSIVAATDLFNKKHKKIYDKCEAMNQIVNKEQEVQENHQRDNQIEI